MGAAGQDSTDLYLRNRVSVLIHTIRNYLSRTPGRNHLVRFDDDISVLVLDVIAGEPSGNPFLQALYLLFSLHECIYIHSRNLFPRLRAVGLPDDQILRDIHHTAGQISGIGCTKGGVGKSLPRSVCRHEILQYVQTLTEIGLNRQLDGVSCRIRHQTAHTGQLFNLLIRTTGSGIRHHVDVVIFIQTVQKVFGQPVVCLLPGLHNLFVALFVRNQTTLVVSRDLIHGFLRLRKKLRLIRRHRHIGNGYRHAGPCRCVIAHGLDMIQNLCGPGRPVNINHLFQNLFQVLFRDHEINFRKKLVAGNRPVHIAQILRDNLVKEQAPQRRGHRFFNGIALRVLSGTAHMDLCLILNITVLVSKDRLVQILVGSALSDFTRTHLRQVVDAQNHILGRHRNRSSVRRLQQVIRGQQHKAAFRLGFLRQGQMNSHLVSVEVRVERGADQRMQLDCLALYQNRLKRLNTEPVQRRCPVQHNRMLLDDIFQNIPDLGLQSFHHLLGILDVMGCAVGNQLFHDKGLEQLNRHFLRQTALIDFQLRSVNDNGTSGIVHTFSQKVLTETTVLSLQQVRQGLQCPVSGSGNRTASSAVVDQGIHSLLQHSFFVSDNDVRGSQIKQTFQPVVPVDNPAVKIIQIRGSKSAAVQLHHRTEIRRDNRDAVQNHPLRTVSGFLEGLYNLQSLDNAGTFLTAGIFQLGAQLFILLIQVNFLQQLLNRLRAHSCAESISVGLIGLLVFRLGEHLLFHQICLARIQNNIAGEIQNPLQCSGRQIQDQSHAGRNSLKIPDVRNRSSQFNMSHALAADTGFCDFHAAALADDAFIADFLVFSAMALPVLGRSEDNLAEQSVLLRFQGTVVDGFRFFYLAVGPLADSFRRCQPDPDCVKAERLVRFFLIYCFRH